MWKQTPRWCNLVKSVTWEDTKGLHCKYPGKLHTITYNFNARNCIGALTGKPNAVLANGIIRSLVRARKWTLRLVMSFIATTSKRLNYVCPAANRTWQRLTIISCDLKHERDTYFLSISHIIYLNYYLPRINRLQSKPLRLIKTNRVNSIIPS